MDPSLAFWTAAIVDLALVVALATAGVLRIRRGDVAGHRRRMLLAAGGISLFLLAYLGKLASLGREDRSHWHPADFAVFYVHELCIAGMLVGGIVAGVCAWRFGPAARAARTPAEIPVSRLRDVHRRAGRIAVAAGAGGLATACLLLLGMYARAGD